jgi:hypothetical protein
LSTDLALRTVRIDGKTVVGGGAADLPPGTAETWVKRLPDLEALNGLTALATMSGGICVSEGTEGRYPGSLGQEGALQQMMAIAGKLGLTQPTEVKKWVALRVQEANELLIQDGGDAWDKVMAALLQKGHLSGDEVRAIVAEVRD